MGRVCFVYILRQKCIKMSSAFSVYSVGQLNIENDLYAIEAQNEAKIAPVIKVVNKNLHLFKWIQEAY